VKTAKIVARLVAGILVALALNLSGCNEREPDYPARKMPEGLMLDPVQLQAGHEMFMGKCASCHGKPSEGRSARASFFDPPAMDFSDARYREIDPAYLFWRIEVGKTVEPYLSRGSVMPAWRGLSDREIWQLVAYLKTRSE
jgi:mono/diheme cytochrome c family protein